LNVPTFNHERIVAMAKRNAQRVTSKKAASAAAKVLSNPRSTKVEKTAAASALAQRPNKPKSK
jgi:hypothetical protein